MGIELPDSVNQMTTMMSSQIDVDELKKLKLWRQYHYPIFSLVNT